jgi:hypothetical protein
MNATVTAQATHRRRSSITERAERWPDLSLSSGAGVPHIRGRARVIAVEPAPPPEGAVEGGGAAEGASPAAQETVTDMPCGGGKFTGQVREGVPHGVGTWTGEGRTVRGAFRYGKPNGTCTYTYSSGPYAVQGTWVYEGNMVRTDRHTQAAGTRVLHALHARVHTQPPPSPPPPPRAGVRLLSGPRQADAVGRGGICG